VLEPEAISFTAPVLFSVLYRAANDDQVSKLQYDNTAWPGPVEFKGAITNLKVVRDQVVANAGITSLERVSRARMTVAVTTPA
jgi:hypothetical protein